MEIKGLIEEFLFDCQARNLAPLTVENYRKQLYHFEKFLRSKSGISDLAQVKPTHIKQFLNYYIQRDCKASYVNDNLKAVKVLCRYAYSEGYTEELLTEKIKNVKEPKVLIHPFRSDDITKMVRYYKGNSYIELRNRLILMILFDTGIRVSELINMQEDQIKESYFIIYGKGRKERVVPKNPMVSKYMVKYLQKREQYFACRDAEDYVFLSKNGKRLTEEAIRKMMKDVAKAVNVDPRIRISPHTCRHTFAHMQLKNGLDLYSLSRLLGHENVSITQRYLESIEDTQILDSARKTSVLGNIHKLNH